MCGKPPVGVRISRHEVSFELVTSGTEDLIEALVVFIEQMFTVCFDGDDSGLSYGPYKQVVAIKLLNTYTNNEPQNPHGYTEHVKMKYEATKAIARKFPNGTAALMELLTTTQPPLD